MREVCFCEEVHLIFLCACCVRVFRGPSSRSRIEDGAESVRGLRRPISDVRGLDIVYIDYIY